MISAVGGGGVQGEAAMDYEVPLQSGEHSQQHWKETIDLQILTGVLC